MTQNGSQNLGALLPFYLNGTLSEDEKSRVELALKTDATLRRDCNALRHIQAQMKNETFETSPGALGWARLDRALDAEPASVANFNTRPRLKMGLIAACAALFGAGVATLAVFLGGFFYVRHRRRKGENIAFSAE